MTCDTKTTQSPPWNAAFSLANTHAIPDFVADQTHRCLTVVPQSLEVLVGDLIPGLSYEWVYTRRQSQCQKHAEGDTMCVCVRDREWERLPPPRYRCLMYPTLWLSHRYMSDIWRWNFLVLVGDSMWGLLHEWVRSHSGTWWRRPIGCLKLLIISRKRATNHRALMRKMTYKDKASYGSSPPCSIYMYMSG